MPPAKPDPSGHDPVEAIAAALATLRPRRRPPWFDGQHHGPHPHAGRHGFGPPPWMAGDRARFAGPARLRLLDALVSASGALTVSEIAEAVGVDQPRASRLVQQGVELGLVRREADPDDARRTRVAFTEQGEAMVRGFRGERRDLVRTALESFTDDEKRELARLLAKLADGWSGG